MLQLAGLYIVFAVVVLLALGIAKSPLSDRVKQLVIAGLVLRVVGALVYVELFGSYYGGGDYEMYFARGSQYATLIWDGRLSDVVDMWLARDWWGTSFTILFTGAVVTILGPNLKAVAIVFALISYGGLLLTAVAFRRAFPDAARTRYLAWLVLFPSLWFWPAAIGKDALILFGLGLAAFGFAGRAGKVRWLSLALGVGLVLAVRPQVAAVCVVALIVGMFLGSGGRLGFRRIAQSILAAGLAIVILVSAGGALGLQLHDGGEVETYLDRRLNSSAIGGSATAEQGTARVSPATAIINVALRPFPWEARGFGMAIAAAEIFTLWALIVFHFGTIRAFMSENWRSRLVLFAVVFTVLYAILLGLALGNLGIIARQRIFLFPFLFLLIAARVPVKSMVRVPGGRFARSIPASRAT
jgi:hypothetical protein